MLTIEKGRRAVLSMGGQALTLDSLEKIRPPNGQNIIIQRPHGIGNQHGASLLLPGKLPPGVGHCLAVGNTAN